MCALAEIMAGLGFAVQGSDRSDGLTMQHLREIGIPVFIGHDPKTITKDLDAVIFSAAIQRENPEIQAAMEREIPVVRRAELLGQIMAHHHALAVSGTHGKTTTTGMLVQIFQAKGVDPSWIAGGSWVGGKPGNAGKSSFLIVEADEFDRAFLSFYPTSVIVTNIDSDHLDTYGTRENLEAAFVTFLERRPFFGTALVNAEDPGVKRVRDRIKGRVRTFGLESGDYQARDVVMSLTGTQFSIYYRDENLGSIKLNVWGLHNVRNGLAASALAYEEGLSFLSIQKGLASFTGMRRRMEKIGTQSGILVLDDYAHHPTEVEAVLLALRTLNPEGRLCIIFQPHLYSRTRQFCQEFAQAFLHCDRLFVLPVYSAREKPEAGIEGDALVAAAIRLGHPSARYIPNREVVVAELLQVLKPGDICVTMGAGDVGDLAKKIREAIP